MRACPQCQKPVTRPRSRYCSKRCADNGQQKRRRLRNSPNLPVEPIIEMLRSRYYLKDGDGWRANKNADHSLKEDARRLAERLSPLNVERKAVNILTRVEDLLGSKRPEGGSIRIDTAEMVCMFMRLHPFHIWGDDYVRAALNATKHLEDDEEIAA